MRREWSGWIKNRQWGELERLAKTDPSQSLADTVAELERGFPEKTDRRALRKVLFLLGQAGFRPQPIEETEPEPAAPAAPREWAFLLSADAGGDSVITYGCETGERVRFLVAHVHHELGVTRAGEEEHFREAGLARVETLRRLDPGPFVHAEVPVDFAKGRISEAMRRNRIPLPPTLAYWRSTLDVVRPVPHPAEGLPRGGDDEAIARLLLEREAAFTWRLEFGTASPLVERMFELRGEDGLSEEEMKQRVEDARREAARTVFTPGVIDDHVGRLLDLGYLLYLRGRPGSELALAAADSLRERGPESPYAEALLDKTLMVLVEGLRRQREEVAG